MFPPGHLDKQFEENLRKKTVRMIIGGYANAALQE
jgi:hypothetical protein